MPALSTPFSSPDAVLPGRQWRWISAASIVGNIALNYVSQAYPFNGQTNGAVSGKYPTLLTPAGYAFSIWGLIFLSLLLYAAWQLLPAQRRNPLPDAVALPLTLANLLTGLWLVVFAYERLALSALVMLGILLSLILVYGRARRLVLAGESPALSSLPFALFLGWISVATVINVTLGLWSWGWHGEENVRVLLTALLLAVVVALGLLVAYSFREAAFPLVVAWALVAIGVARQSAYPELMWVAWGGAVVVAVGGLILSRRRLQVAVGL
ncbi:hypothetical protein MUN82_15340 [Hymenobacter aerilatus]|uniref:Tryptophan-rich sensory protein n=1 Tax=Hymenobacter aerilatus TaxID=2932251 RepID=A0A8T9SX11_9BACT|nr:hypothetical protein [Hymenobacter aerilatus]UOR04309.1 hypothetical protein MUN82_15340 [Hymenobacter aerilatus]